MVVIADSAEAKPAGARINPQAAAANPISVSNMARMAGLRPSVESMSAGSTGGGRSGFKGQFKNFHKRRRDCRQIAIWRRDSTLSPQSRVNAEKGPAAGGRGRAFLGLSQVPS
jgi:hypothetical protein